MRGAVVVRRALSSDFDTLLAMKSEVEAVKWSGFAGPPDANRFRQWFEQALASPDHVMFTGVYDDVVCGYVNLSRAGPNTFNSSNGVASDFTGLGIGSVMLRVAFDELRSLFPGVGIETWVADGNVASQLMLRILGYRATEATREQNFFCPTRTDIMRQWTHKTVRV